MPNIEEFTAGNVDIRPQEIGVESTAAAGRRLGVYGSQIAESYTQAGRALGQVATAAENYLQHREINTGAKQGADLIAAKNQSWSDFITGRDIPQDAPNRQDLIDQRINNPNVAKQWREQSLEPDLQQFQQGFLTPGGAQWASEFANRYRQHMAEHTAADQSSMAGAVVQANLEKATDAYATATFNDPSSLKTNFDLLDHSLGGSVGSHPTLSPVESARISGEIGQRAKERLVQSAVQGAIMKGGNWQAIASDPAYKEYIKPAENAMFERQAHYYEKVAESQQKHEIAQQRADNTQAGKDAEKKIIQSLIPTDAGTPPPTPGDLHRAESDFGAMEGVTAPQLNRMRKTIDTYVRHLNDPDQPTLKAEYDALAARLGDPNNPLTIHEVIDNSANLSTKAKKDLVWSIKALNTEEMKDPKLLNALSGAKQMIQGSGIERQMQAGKYAEFVNAFLPEYYREKRAGTLPKDVDALDLSNEKSMISTAMQPYRNSLGANILMNGGGVPPAQPTYTAPAAAPAAPAVALPPKADRVKGQSYMTGRGLMQWTGTGWLPPQTQVPTLAPGEM